jgi:hypothetical protein
LSGSRKGQTAGFCEHGNEHISFIKLWEFLDELRNSQLIKNERKIRNLQICCIVLPKKIFGLDNPNSLCSKSLGCAQLRRTMIKIIVTSLTKNNVPGIRPSVCVCKNSADVWEVPMDVQASLQARLGPYRRLDNADGQNGVSLSLFLAPVAGATRTW